MLFWEAAFRFRNLLSRMPLVISSDVPTASPETLPAELSELLPLSPAAVAASEPFVGRWNHLVSTTNWEKGRIVSQWRDALVAAGAAVADYSDEAWGSLVGGVTGQHVGRLRRVFQKFGRSWEQYQGLYWSHFQAALDWTDAEMWLEGAVQNGWSVAAMRERRWETLGKLEADRPRADDAPASETDEDFEPARTSDPLPNSITGKYEQVAGGPLHEGPDFGDDEPGGSVAREFSGERGMEFEAGRESAGPPVELVRPFENLPTLPDDLADAFDSLKLAILHHKTDGWKRALAADVLQTLEALQALVLAPSSEAAAF
jgi:hypothetical protein